MMQRGEPSAVPAAVLLLVLMSGTVYLAFLLNDDVGVQVTGAPGIEVPLTLPAEIQLCIVAVVACAVGILALELTRPARPKA